MNPDAAYERDLATLRLTFGVDSARPLTAPSSPSVGAMQPREAVLVPAASREPRGALHVLRGGRAE